MTMVPKQRARYAQAAVLTAAAFLIVLTLCIIYGPIAFILTAIGLPVPLVLLWASADVLRTDEREQRRAHVTSPRRSAGHSIEARHPA
jgi:hypothetical protein